MKLQSTLMAILGLSLYCGVGCNVASNEMTSASQQGQGQGQDQEQNPNQDQDQANDEQEPQPEDNTGNPNTGGGNQAQVCTGLPDKSGKYTISFSDQGVTRTAKISIPTNYNKTNAAPIIFSFHGLTSTATQQESIFKMDQQGNKAGFITVHPQGVDNSWNAGTCCGSKTVNDVAFFRTLVNKLSAELCINKKRIYVTGLSNGGYLSYRLACEAADIVTAAAPVAGALGINNCNPSKVVPIFHSHGTSDTLVAYSAGVNATNTFAQLNGCTQPKKTVLQDGDWKCEQMSPCSGKSEVSLCTVNGGGHVLPWYFSSGASTNATDLIIKFFMRH